MIKIKNPSYLVGLVTTAAMNMSHGIAVDTELMLLVDVSGSVDEAEYSLMMDGYQQAFRNNSVIDSIRSGERGQIAASVVFWSGANDQEIGVEWTLIDSEESANNFADQLQKTTRPFSGMTAIGSGIDFGTQLFGSETGGIDNGFASISQIIDVSGDGTDNNTPPVNTDRAANVRASRDLALDSGVDMINGLPIGNAGGALEQYYANNVIGGSAGGVDAFTQAAVDFADIENALVRKLEREVSAGAVESISAAIPEVNSAILICGGLGLLSFRRVR